MRPTTPRDVVRSHLPVLSEVVKKAGNWTFGATAREIQIVIANILLSAKDDIDSDERQTTYLAVLGLMFCYSSYADVLRVVPTLSAKSHEQFSELDDAGRTDLLKEVQNELLMMLPSDAFFVLVVYHIPPAAAGQVSPVTLDIAASTNDAAIVSTILGAASSSLAAEAKNPPDQPPGHEGPNPTGL